MNNRIYIDYLLALKKEGPFSPFVIEWLPLHGRELQRAWLLTEDSAFREHEYEELESVRPGARFLDVLNRLKPSIESYPYNWPISGVSLDPEGYDFTLHEIGRDIEIEPIAYFEALRLLNIPEVLPDKTETYLEDKRVSGGHLTKFQLTFQKASPVSYLSFQLFSENPVELLSLVSERDLHGSEEPEAINLDAVQLQENGSTITLLFGQPIFAKRFTFILGQNNASSNKYYVTQDGEDFKYTLTNKDSQHLADMVSTYHQGETFITDDILSNEAIQDWSPARKNAYLKWRETVERNDDE